MSRILNFFNSSMVAKALIKSLPFLAFSYLFLFVFKGSIELFFLRFFLILLFSLFTVSMGDNLKQVWTMAVIEIEASDRKLLQLYPFFKWEGPLFVFSFFGCYIVMWCAANPGSEWGALCLVILVAQISLAFLVILKVLAIVTTPDIREHYNVIRSIKLHGFRSFGTISKVAALCKNCLTTTAGVFVGGVAAPILIDGNLDARGFAVNIFANLVHDTGASTHEEMQRFLELKKKSPEEAAKVIGKDWTGWIKNVDSVFLDEASKKAGILKGRPLVSVDFDHDVKPGAFYKSFWRP